MKGDAPLNADSISSAALRRCDGCTGAPLDGGDPGSPQSSRSGEFLVNSLIAGDAMRAKGAVLAGADTNAGRDSRGYTALHLAVEWGSLGLCRLIMAHLADVNAVSHSNGVTPLHLASLGKNAAMVKALSQAKADANILSADGLAPMSFCHNERGPRDPLKAALEKAQKASPRPGKDPDSSPEEPMSPSSPTPKASSSRRARGCTPCYGEPKDPLKGANGICVIGAIHSGDIMRAQGMVLAGAELNSARDLQGFSALHLAAMQGRTGLARLLVDHLAEIDSTSDGRQSTPLHLAALYGYPTTVRLLLELRASVNISNADGETPLSLSVLDGNLEIVRQLTDAKARPDISVAAAGDVSADANEEISFLSAISRSSSTPGSPTSGAKQGVAGTTNSSSAGARIGLLLDSLVDTSRPESPLSPLSPLSPTSHPKSALLQAVKSNTDKEIIAELFKAGAVAHTDDSAQPSLLLATQNGNMRVARFLLESRADPDGCDQAQHTAMHFAARNGSSRLIKLLADSRADVNSKDRDGLSPIQYANDGATEKQLMQLGAKKVLEGPWHTRAKLRASAPALPRVFSPPSGPTSPNSHSAPAGLFLKSGSAPGSPVPRSPARGARSRGTRGANRSALTSGHMMASRDSSLSGLCGTGSMFSSLQTTQEPTSSVASMTVHQSASSLLLPQTPPTSGPPFDLEWRRAARSPPSSDIQGLGRAQYSRNPQTAWG